MTKIKKEKIQTPFQESLKKVLPNKLCLVNLIALAIPILFSIFGPMFVGYGSDSIDLLNIPTGPSDTHLLGAGELGRDMFTRLAEGGRVFISVGLIVTLFELCIGVLLGCIAGLYGGIVEDVIMRIVDTIMCLPFFIIVLCIVAITGPSFHNTIFVIGILGQPGVCRIMHSQVLSLKNIEYVDAVRSLGLNQMEIIFRHILPNASGPIIACTTLSVASAILVEASLSFLGLGIAMPQSSWGTILPTAQNMQTLQGCWWMWIPAGILALSTVPATNFLGDGLPEILDPKKEGKDADQWRNMIYSFN